MPRKSSSKCISRSKLPLDTHQRKVVEFLQNDDVRGLLVVHGVGTGKTLTGVTVSQCFLDSNPGGNVIVVTPTSLQENFVKEYMRYKGQGVKPGKKPEMDDERYRFFTIQGLTAAIKKGSFSSQQCYNSLLILDEAHNIRAEVDDDCDKVGVNARHLIECAKIASKVLLLSATPLINRPCELINLMSMVDGIDPIPVRKFRLVDYEKYFRCKVSIYFPPKEALEKDYPKEVKEDVFLEMDKRYLRLYKRVEDYPTESERAFYNAIRRGSNNLLDDKSPKVGWIMSHIADSADKDKYVIFSHFLGAGLEMLMIKLKENGIKYAHVTGSVAKATREKAVRDYNEDKIKVLLISKAGGEGLDLKNTTNMIVMEPAWNESTHIQVIGRAVRKGSHASLPPSERKVNVYRLFLIKPSEKKIVKDATAELWTQNEIGSERLSVDLYLRNFAMKKQIEIEEFMKILQTASIEKRRCTKTVPYRDVRRSSKNRKSKKSKKEKKEKKENNKGKKSVSKKSKRKDKSKSPKKCRSNQEINPLTGRCWKRCEEVKIRNEKGICVNKK